MLAEIAYVQEEVNQRRSDIEGNVGKVVEKGQRRGYGFIEGKQRKVGTPYYVVGPDDFPWGGGGQKPLVLSGALGTTLGVASGDPQP